MTAITFIVPAGDEKVLERCLLSSSAFGAGSKHQLLVERGFRSASAAFNDGLDRAENDLIVCLHQDVILPDTWAERFIAEFEKLERGAEPVGVVGCAGCTGDGRAAAHIYRHDREFHAAVPLPAAVETLDEMLIGFRKSSGLRFDRNQPSFFGYAVDLCLQAVTAQRQNFAVDVPCFHQAKSREGLGIARENFEVLNYLCDKWNAYLPVHTLCGPLAHKRSYRVYSFVQTAKRFVGYAPKPWWHSLPVIDPATAMRGEHLRAASCFEDAREGA